MEQTIAFVLGVFAVLALAGVLSMFKTRSQVKDLYEEIEDLQDVINELERQIHRDNEMLDRRIDQEIDRTNESADRLHDYIDLHVDKINTKHEDIYKYVDSRTDKMTDGISKHIAEINSFIDLTQHAVDKVQHELAGLQVTVENKLNNK